jgi:hypothetical protein
MKIPEVDCNNVGWGFAMSFCPGLFPQTFRGYFTSVRWSNSGCQSPSSTEFETALLQPTGQLKFLKSISVVLELYRTRFEVEMAPGNVGISIALLFEN